MAGVSAVGPTVRARPRPRSRIGWTLVVLSSLGVAGNSLYTYAQGSLRTMADAEVGLAGIYVTAPLVVQAAFFAHVASASLALVLGPWQFSRRLRSRFPVVHRYAGRTYFVSVALGAASALILAPFNSAGMVGFFGFIGLVALWMFTALQGYTAALNRNFSYHQAWMIRNYAFTYAASTLRIWLGVLILVQLPFVDADTNFQALFDNAYNAVPFLCWVPNMFIAEWLIRRRGLPSYRLQPASSERPSRSGQ